MCIFYTTLLILIHNAKVKCNLNNPRLFYLLFDRESHNYSLNNNRAYSRCGNLGGTHNKKEP
jgi:hypothetical protein